MAEKKTKTKAEVEEQPTKLTTIKAKTTAKPKTTVTKKAVAKPKPKEAKVAEPKVEAKVEVKKEVVPEPKPEPKPKPDYGKCSVCGLGLESILHDSRAAVPQYDIVCNNKSCSNYRFIVARK